MFYTGCCCRALISGKGEVYVRKKGSVVVVNPMSSSAFQTAVVVVERCEIILPRNFARYSLAHMNRLAPSETLMAFPNVSSAVGACSMPIFSLFKGR